MRIHILSIYSHIGTVVDQAPHPPNGSRYLTLQTGTA